MLILGNLLAFAIAFWFGQYLVKSSSFLSIFDYPNSRSLHRQPIPRTGGLAILGGFFLGSLCTSAVYFLWGAVLVGLLPLAVVSLLDDYRSIAARWRILTHLLAAVSPLVAGLAPDRLELPGFAWLLPSWLAIVLALLFIVWMINLYNFMDGMDGFAGGMAVIGFATLAWLGRADPGFVAFCLTVAAASAGFLMHNFPPAKIFLGDAGSTTLGFLAAACSLWGSRIELFPFWVALLIFSPFIVDATVTLLRRLLHGEKVWEAHRSHYYQRLVLLGWGHRRTVLAEYTLMLACGGSALLAVRLPAAGQTALAIVWVWIYGLLMAGVGWLEQRHATVSAREARTLSQSSHRCPPHSADRR